jgi:hypothetical protein
MTLTGESGEQGSQDSSSGSTTSNVGSTSTATGTGTQGSGTTSTTSGTNSGSSSDDSSTASTDSTGETTTDTTTDSSTTTQTTIPTGELACEGKVYACGNQIDDDADGLIDLYDPECISPCDDDEGSFMTQLPGQNSDCKADCYFDADSGVGNDHCNYDLRCDPQDPGADIGCQYGGDADEPWCAPDVPEICLDVCVPRLPNGCDCFGCCEVNSASEGLIHIYLGSNTDCALNNLDACGRCTFQESCANPCDRESCELCFGDDPNDLPEDCDGVTSCDNGAISCTDTSDCPADSFCQTGCCLTISPG